MCLQKNNFNATMEMAELAELYEMKKKEALISEVCNLDLSKKIKTRTNDGRAYVYINRVQYVAPNRKTLVDNLYEKFVNVLTFEEVYKKWLIYRRDETKVTAKTIKENMYLWDAHVAKNSLASKKIKEITPTNMHTFFKELTKDNGMAKERFRDLKSVLNCVFKYAVANNHIEKSPLKGFDYSIYGFKPSNVNSLDKAYTFEEVHILTSYLKTVADCYSLAAQFALCLPLRIAEIKALTWNDIFKKQSKNGKVITYIRIQKQVLEIQELQDDLTFSPRETRTVDHIKGNTDKGFRNIPLNDRALEILKLAKELNADSPYIFAKTDKKPFATVTFNRHLKKFCESANVPYRSSHAIRFTTASMYYYNNVPLKKIQEYLGHTTLAMTLHYLRDILSNDEEILDCINKLPA